MHNHLHLAAEPGRNACSTAHNVVMCADGTRSISSKPLSCTQDVTSGGTAQASTAQAHGTARWRCPPTLHWTLDPPSQPLGDHPAQHAYYQAQHADYSTQQSITSRTAQAAGAHDPTAGTFATLSTNLLQCHSISRRCAPRRVGHKPGTTLLSAALAGDRRSPRKTPPAPCMHPIPNPTSQLPRHPHFLLRTVPCGGRSRDGRGWQRSYHVATLPSTR